MVAEEMSSIGTEVGFDERTSASDSNASTADVMLGVAGNSEDFVSVLKALYRDTARCAARNRHSRLNYEHDPDSLPPAGKQMSGKDVWMKVYRPFQFTTTAIAPRSSRVPIQ